MSPDDHLHTYCAQSSTSECKKPMKHEFSYICTCSGFLWLPVSTFSLQSLANIDDVVNKIRLKIRLVCENAPMTTYLCFLFFAVDTFLTFVDVMSHPTGDWTTTSERWWGDRPMLDRMADRWDEITHCNFWPLCPLARCRNTVSGTSTTHT